MNPHRTRRRARAVAISALGMLAASTLLGGSVHAQTDGEPVALGGYEGRAHSSGLHLFYNPEGLLPTAAIVDVGAPDALATITSGPTTFARASVADPGDLLVNPDALLTQADPSWPEGTVPAYPFRISATSSFGEPEAESNPAPGFDARVEATPEGSISQSRTPAFAAPGVLSAGSVSSRATTTFANDAVQVHARTEVSSFDLLGLLKIESIVTDVVAETTGIDTRVSGGTVISGATFMDQPVIIDEDGIRTDPDAEEPQVPLLGSIRDSGASAVLEALADAGLTISLPGPVEHDGETSGTIGSTGLRIELELSERTVPVLGQILDQLPPLENPIPDAPGPADAIVFLRATHLTALEIGRAEVSLTAREAFVPPPFEAPSMPAASPAPAGAAPSAAPALSPPVDRALAPAPPANAAPGGAGAPVATSTEGTPAASLGAGIGALAVLALLAQPFLGDRLSRAAGAVLATSPTDTCPLEVR